MRFQGDRKMRTKYGVTVLLDALGISGNSIKESKIFIKNRDFTIELIEEFSKPLKKKFGTSKVYTFGDTLLLAWENT